MSYFHNGLIVILVNWFKKTKRLNHKTYKNNSSPSTYLCFSEMCANSHFHQNSNFKKLYKGKRA